MESTKRAIKFQLNESKRSILVFLSVVILIDIFALILNKNISITMGLSEGQFFSIMGLNILPIIVYFISYNYESYYKQFPIALSFSITRKEYFKSMIVNNIFIVFILVVIQSLLMKIDPVLVRLIGKEPMYDFKIFNTHTDGIIFIMIYLFIAFLLFSTICHIYSYNSITLYSNLFYHNKYRY